MSVGDSTKVDSPTEDAVPDTLGKKKPEKKPALPETAEGLPWPSNHEIKKENNPFTDSDWRMWIYAWSGLVVRIAIIMGGLFSIYQYLEISEEKRLNKTFELLEEWEKPEYQTAQIALRERIVGLNTRYASLLPADATALERGVYLDRIGLAALSADGGTMPLPEFKAHFDRIVSFLNRVSTCVQGNQCSREVTNDYFRDFAVSFWNYFGKYSRQMRQSGSTTFSVPLEEFVTGTRPDVSSGIQASSK